MIQQIGKHRVRHGDINDAAGLSQLTQGVMADIFYSDPPWGSGNLKYWETMNRKMNNTTASVITTDVETFLKTVLSNAAEHTNGWVVIEYGKRWTDQVIQLAKEAGLHYCGKVETLYSGGRPLDNIFFHTAGPRSIDLSSIHHLTGYNCVKQIFKLLKPEAGGVGMDLCCGMGYTAQACVDNGLSFIGNELNKKRLEKTIKRLQGDKNK